MKQYSTREVAKELGLHLATIQRYLAEGKIPAPPVQQVGAGKFRIWTDEDIEKVREVLPKIANGRKTRYKKEPAVSKQQSAKAKPRKPKKK
jgi:excisionase family DNA binding protein